MNIIGAVNTALILIMLFYVYPVKKNEINFITITVYRLSNC